MLKQLWYDDAGFIASADLVLIATILVIGTIVGLTTMRDQVVQELGDLATALGLLNQSYSYSGVTITNGSFTATVAGSSYTDASDDCDATDTAGMPPACISLSIDGVAE